MYDLPNAKSGKIHFERPEPKVKWYIIFFLLMIYSVERNIYSGKERNESTTSINDKVLNVWMKYFFYLIKILETLSSNSDKTNDIYSQDL